jgi:hypothetical protein
MGFWFINLFLIFEETSKFPAASYKNESNLLLVRITVCVESFLPIVEFPAFLEHGSAEKIVVCAHANRFPNRQEVGFILYEAAQNFKVFQKFKTKIKKSSWWLFKGLFQWYHSYADPIWLDGTFKRQPFVLGPEQAQKWRFV